MSDQSLSRINADENVLIKVSDHSENSPYSMESKEHVLRDLDEEPLGWFHLRTVIVSGVGFFTDAYDLFIINLVMPMIGYVYFTQNGNHVPSIIDGAVKAMSTLGTLFGQLIFGYLADAMGRKRMYGVELMIMIVATFGCTLSASMVRGMDIAAVLGFWRFLLGFGIGGDYPLSAVITSEFAPRKHRGMMIAAVFSMQGMGILVAAIMAIIVLSCFKTAILSDPFMLDYVWRICVGLAIIPSLFALYFRLTIPETPRFTAHVTGNVNHAAIDAQTVLKMNRDQKEAYVKKEAEKLSSSFEGRPTFQEFKNHFSRWENLKVLLGCSITWFALDVAFYGVNLNQSLVLQAIGFIPDGANAYDTIYTLAIGNLLINLMGTVPGYYFTVFLIDRMGRLRIQYMGFTLLTILFVILASSYHSLLQYSVPLFVVLIGFAQFFFNFGPNVTTFVIPGEVFPTRFRSTAHGISAASGKFGALLATYAFGPLKDIGGRNQSMPVVLWIFAVFMFVGLIATRWVPESKNKSLEEFQPWESNGVNQNRPS